MTDADSRPRLSRHDKLIEEIRSSLSRQANFPTCLDDALRVRDALEQEQLSLEDLGDVIARSPLIAARILRLANTAAYNPAGKPVCDLHTAISRVGFAAVRAVSLAIAIAQMQAPKQPAAFTGIARQALSHSIEVAAIARTLARRLGCCNPEEALLAGLVHDIGIFYLLYRATGHPDYERDPALLDDLLLQEHEATGEQLLQALGLPARIILAVRDHERLEHVEAPSSIRDLLYFANLLAIPCEEESPSHYPDDERTLRELDRKRFEPLLQASEADIADLRSALAA